jgi:hypothetical protein
MEDSDTQVQVLLDDGPDGDAVLREVEGGDDDVDAALGRLLASVSLDDARNRLAVLVLHKQRQVRAGASRVRWPPPVHTRPRPRPAPRVGRSSPPCARTTTAS